MESNVELSKHQKRSKNPPNKYKPPDIPQAATLTQNYYPAATIQNPSPTLSYAESAQAVKTPTQSRKRSLPDDPSTTVRRQVPAPPHRSDVYTPTPSKHIPLPPIQLFANHHAPDHVMQDPFNQSQGPIDWADDVNKDNFYDRVNKVHTLLRELHQELDNAQRDDSLQGVLEDEDIDEQLIKLSAILPSYTSNSHITPVMKSISDLQKAIAQVSDRLDKSEAQLTLNSKNKSLSGSIHATLISALKSSPVRFFTLLGRKPGPNRSYFFRNSSEPWTGLHRTGSMWFGLGSETGSDQFYIQILYKLLFTTK